MVDLKKRDKNEIFIGIKPFSSYLMATKIQFDKGNREVILKARGKSMVTAINVAECLKTADNGIYIKSIKSSSDTFTGKEGRDINVSAISIILEKK